MRLLRGLWLLGAGVLLVSLPFFERMERLAPWEPELEKEGSFYASQGGFALPGLASALYALLPPTPEGPVLLDRRHSSERRDQDTLGLVGKSDDFRGMSRAFSNLPELRDFGLALSPAMLAGSSAVILNLPSGHRPGFSYTEVLAILEYVQAGGGLLLITDSSNQDLHAELLQPLALRFGFALPPVTVAESREDLLFSPLRPAMFRAEVLEGHPITAGLGTVVVQAAGELRGPEGWRPLVDAPLGPEWRPLLRGGRWADRWDPTDVGNFQGDLKEGAKEPSGARVLAAARELGKGRVVVLSDQSAWTDAMIGLEDNARFFARVLDWVVGRELKKEEAPLLRTGGPRGAGGCGDPSPTGYRSLQALAQRVAAHRGYAERCGPGEARIHLPGSEGDFPREGRVLLLQENPPLVVPAPGETATESKATLPHPLLRKQGAPTLQVWRSEQLLYQGQPFLPDRSLELLLLPAEDYRNQNLGSEREEPSRGAPARQEAWRSALAALAWLTEE
ncbi:MAG TPA: hypothetical protein PLA94_20525 [Myxococcota bacterium]|nr:hypothetical protein [Myxococcota bacterium]